MSRAALAYLEHVLDAEWEEDISGRVQSVPKPHIRIEGDIKETRLDQFDGDLMFIRDGGPQPNTPKSFGYTHKEVEDLLTVDIRTSRGRGRLEGVRNDQNEAERYGGLRGETERVLDLIRKGDQEYDLIVGFEWNDISAEVGYMFWRGTWEIRLTQKALNIDPTP